MNTNFSILDIAEFDYMPEVVKKENPEKYDSISRFLSENNNKAAFFLEHRYPEGLREEENPELIKKWFVVESAPSSAYSPAPASMTPQTILEILGNHISVILEKFKTEQKKQFIGFLSEIGGTAECKKKKKTDNLYDFCLDFSFLAEIFRTASYSYAADTGTATRGLKSIGGKPAAPETKAENQVHLLANELVRIVQDDLKEIE